MAGAKTAKSGSPAAATVEAGEYRKVLRPFGGAGGRIYEPGEVVETSHWKNAQRLVQISRLSELIPIELLEDEDDSSES